MCTTQDRFSSSSALPGKNDLSVGRPAIGRTRLDVGKKILEWEVPPCAEPASVRQITQGSRDGTRSHSPGQGHKILVFPRQTSG